MRPKAPTLAQRRPGFPLAHLRAESVPRPVAALADTLERGARIPPHRHERAQLIFATEGTLTVRAERAYWILPASHALWMPAGTVHEVRAGTRVEMRTLYIQPAHARAIRDECHVLFVSPLLRELILRAMELPALYDEQAMEGRLMTLIVDEVARLPPQPLGLRIPTDARLAKLCERMLRDVATHEGMARLGAAVGLSERSVIRLFRKQTGLSFRSWHNQARLLKAFELLALGRNLTDIALEVGYSSPSAFTKMFRRTFGKPPTAMRRVS